MKKLLTVFICLLALNPIQAQIIPLDFPDNIEDVYIYAAIRAAQLTQSTACRLCEKWVEKQEDCDEDWLGGLPDCPCTLELIDSANAENPDEGVWNPISNPGGENDLHPGAYYCMRSIAVAGHPGQQCCYDEEGKLITGGAGAGTPDKVAPEFTPPTLVGGNIGVWIMQNGWRARTLYQHFIKDVYPFFACRIAGELGKYLEHRPPNNGNNCEENEIGPVSEGGCKFTQKNDLVKDPSSIVPRYTNGSLRIHMNDLSGDLRIFDLSGKLIYQSEKIPAYSETQLPIGLVDGIYVYVLSLYDQFGQKKETVSDRLLVKQ